LRRSHGYAKLKVMPTSPTTANEPAKASSAQHQAEPAARPLPEAARRDERARLGSQVPQSENPKEVAGRGGLDPTRYGDWEVNGLASDF
jgi:hypothetical protein